MAVSIFVAATGVIWLKSLELVRKSGEFETARNSLWSEELMKVSSLHFPSAYGILGEALVSRGEIKLC